MFKKTNPPFLKNGVCFWLILFLAIIHSFVVQAQNKTLAIPTPLNGYDPSNPWRWGYTQSQVKDYVLSRPGWRTIDADSAGAPSNWSGYTSIDKKIVLLFKFDENESLVSRAFIYIQSDKSALALDSLLAKMKQVELNTWIDLNGKATIKRHYEGNSVQYSLTYFP